MTKNKPRRLLIRYINEKIGDVGKDCKIDILNNIAINYNLRILFEEGTGTRILFQHLDMKILNEIRDRIDEDLSEHLIDFNGI